MIKTSLCFKLRQKSFTLPLGLISISAAILLVFQNCADPLEFAGQDAVIQDSSLPFAFEAKVDTISYMSCSNVDLTSFQPRAIYSFRVGAYTPGSTGLRLNQQFRGYVTEDDPARMRSALFNSPANRGASLQLAIRRKMGYQQMLINSEGVIREGFDFANFLAPLDSEAIADRMMSMGPNQWIQFFSGVPGLDRRLMEQSIRFIENEEKADQVRNHMMGLGGVDRPTQLTLTYSADAEEVYFARGPSEVSSDRVYGLGFDLTFRHAHGYNNGPRRALDTIEEFDLLTGQRVPGSSWECGRDSQTFVITKVPEFQNPAWFTGGNIPEISAIDDEKCIAPNSDSFFVMGQDTRIKSAEQEAQVRARLALARRVLRVEDWFIDPVGFCAFPKHEFANCYGDVDAEGEEPVVNMSPASCTTRTCPHFVTICARNT